MDADGSVHTCFDCLLSGKMDQHDKRVKSPEEMGFKV